MNYLVVCYVFDMYLVLIWMVINKLVIENIFLFLMNREIYFFELKEIGKWKKKKMRKNVWVCKSVWCI